MLIMPLYNMEICERKTWLNWKIEIFCLWGCLSTNMRCISLNEVSVLFDLSCVNICPCSSQVPSIQSFKCISGSWVVSVLVLVSRSTIWSTYCYALYFSVLWILNYDDNERATNYQFFIQSLKHISWCWVVGWRKAFMRSINSLKEGIKSIKRTESTLTAMVQT